MTDEEIAYREAAYFAPMTKLTPAQMVGGCRAMHAAQGEGDADELIHHPAQNSWEPPTLPRWAQWVETVGEVYAAIAARARPALAPSTSAQVEGEPVLARAALLKVIGDWVREDVDAGLSGTGDISEDGETVSYIDEAPVNLGRLAERLQGSLSSAMAASPAPVGGAGVTEHSLSRDPGRHPCREQPGADEGTAAALADARENWELTDEFGWATPAEVEQAIAILSMNNGDLAYKIQGCFARGGAFAEPVAGDGNLEACAREAGWALSENVDRLPWERRGRIAAIVQKLGAALLVHEGAPASETPDTTPSTPTPDSAGWIEWKGGRCPVDPRVAVDADTRNGAQYRRMPADIFDWRKHNKEGDIVRYRLSDRLADERSELADHIVDANEKVPPDQSALAGAIERPDQTEVDCAVSELSEWLRMATDEGFEDFDNFDIDHLRNLLADHAAQALRIKALEAGINKAVRLLADTNDCGETRAARAFNALVLARDEPLRQILADAISQGEKADG